MAIPGNLLSLTTESIDPNTSGWTAKLNCTLSLGSGGRNGDGVLTVKSVAAGEMQARTVSSYPVLQGEIYEAFSDASGSTVPERIGIRWLSSTGAEISITWSLTTAVASSSWHRIAVGGMAPVGAVSAQVLLSSTPAGALVNSLFENVYFGLPIRVLGNLLDWNTESMEVDASGWLSVANCTVARTVPVISWSATTYTAGGHVMAATVTAGGNAAMRSLMVPCTEGAEYVGYCYLNPPTAGSACWTELRWYDAADVQLSVVRSPLAAPGTGWYTQRAAGVAPAGATQVALAVGIDGASAAQVVRAERAVISAPPVIRSGSIVPFADASFEQGVAGWTVPSGAATLARSTPWGAQSVDGSYSLTVTSATATTSVVRSPLLDLAEGGGLPWRIEVATKVTAGSWTIIRRVRWYDAGAVEISVSTNLVGPVPTPSWWLLQDEFDAPPTAASARIEYELTATAVASVLQLDIVAAWQAEPIVSVAAQDETGSITLTLRELSAGELVSIWRVGEGGHRTLVRGPDGLYDRVPLVTDLLIVEDYEAPLGMAFTYYVETYSSSTGALASIRGSSPATIDPGDPNEIWLKDPGQPQRNLRVLVERAPDWARPIEQAGYRVRGRRNSVVISDVRGGLEGDLAIWTRTDDERAALHWLLDPGHTLLWQAAPGHGVSDMYVTVAAVTEGRISPDAHELWRTWTLPLTEADMPTAIGVSGSAGRTWQDVLTEHATWQEVLDRYATWEDVLFNIPKGG